jgi:hypothetical protein
MGGGDQQSIPQGSVFDDQQSDKGGLFGKLLGANLKAFANPSNKKDS